MTKVTGWPLKFVAIVCALSAAFAITACGGSSGWTSAQKAKARATLDTQFSSLLAQAKVTAASRAKLESAWKTVENCTLDTIEKKYSPDTKATGPQVNKVLQGACGSRDKAFERTLATVEKSGS